MMKGKLGSFQFVEFNPEKILKKSMDKEIMSRKVKALLDHPIRNILVERFLNRIQSLADPLDSILGYRGKRRPTHFYILGIALLHHS